MALRHFGAAAAFAVTVVLCGLLIPMLGGQNAKYIESALKAYRKGERRFPSMMATAKSLSDQDIADVAAYFASQR